MKAYVIEWTNKDRQAMRVDADGMEPGPNATTFFRSSGIQNGQGQMVAEPIFVAPHHSVELIAHVDTEDKPALVGIDGGDGE